MSKCPHCGGIAGKAHVCRAALQKSRALQQKHQILGTSEVFDPDRDDLAGDMGSAGVDQRSVEAVRAAKDRVEEKFGATQKLTVRLPKGLIKQLKLASVEESLTIERIVELALTGWFEDRT